MTSQRPFLLLRISFPRRPIFIQFPPVPRRAGRECRRRIVYWSHIGVHRRQTVQHPKVWRPVGMGMFTGLPVNLPVKLIYLSASSLLTAAVPTRTPSGRFSWRTSDSDISGRRFNRKISAPSFGFKNGLRFRFGSETRLKYPNSNIFSVWGNLKSKLE